MRVFLFLWAVISPAFAGEMVVNSETLAISGDIEVGDELKLRDLLDEHPQITTIRLGDSRGGDVFTAMQMGNLVRNRKLSTQVSGICQSACPLVFIGGKPRLKVGGEIGFHQVTNAETGEPVLFDDPLYNRLTMYIWGKGPDPIRMISWITSASPESISLISEEELCRARVFTDCERPPSQ